MKPVKSHIYAVGTGSYVGEMFVFVREDEDQYEFISIPKNENRCVPKQKFKIGIDNKILEHVGEIEEDVYNLLEKQFEFNKNLDK